MKTILMIASRDTSISTSLSNVLHEIKSENIDHIFINQIFEQIAFSLKQSNSIELRRTFAKFKVIILTKDYQLVRKLLVCDFLQVPWVQMTYHLFMFCHMCHMSMDSQTRTCASSCKFARVRGSSLEFYRVFLMQNLYAITEFGYHNLRVSI